MLNNLNLLTLTVPFKHGSGGGDVGVELLVVGSVVLLVDTVDTVVVGVKQFQWKISIIHHCEQLAR